MGLIEQQGVFTMSVTPFKENGDIDEAALRRHLQYQAEAGVAVYLLSFGSGEGLQVNYEEMLRIYQIGAEELKGKVPVYAAGQGLGPSTRDFINMCKDIAGTGVDGIQLHCPRPAYPSAAAKPLEVEKYFHDVLDAIHTPMILSVHSMAAPGIQPRPDFLRQLVDMYPHLIGFNISFTINYVAEVIDAMEKKASVRVGGAMQAIDCLALGGDGFLCYETNIAPRLCASVYSDYREGKIAQALKNWAKLMRVFIVLSRYRNPQSIKAAMNILGLGGGYLRRPYLGLDEHEGKAIGEILTSLDIRTMEGLA
ncbi:dihydrodipicolinate synthase family protein [Dehalococcoidia bacterium]|nr:dihydrodipicolinate synthase family protein [Dehalococcoidia bacterium]